MFEQFLLKTTVWKNVEGDEGEFLRVDRISVAILGKQKNVENWGGRAFRDFVWGEKPQFGHI